MFCVGDGYRRGWPSARFLRRNGPDILTNHPVSGPDATSPAGGVPHGPVYVLLRCLFSGIRYRPISSFALRVEFANAGAEFHVIFVSGIRRTMSTDAEYVIKSGDRGSYLLKKKINFS
jgi:hypothetical protein